MTKSSPPKKKLSAQGVRQTSTGWMLKMLGMKLDDEMKDQLKALGLTLDQFKIMMTLLEKDQLTQIQIGKKIMMPGYGLTRNLDKLESAGYIKRGKHHSSRRSHSICVSVQGKTLAPKLFAVVNSVNQKLLSTLDSSEAETFNQTLVKLLNTWKD